MLLIARRIPDVDTAFQKLHTYQVTQTECFDGASTIHDNHIPFYNPHIL